jgi:hypothetical protein
VAKDSLKYSYYFTTNDQSEWSLYRAATDGAVDFYEARGYDYQYKHGTLPTGQYFIDLEVYDFEDSGS